ncbi:hypothetical protein [Coleofasciculus sp.]|uniref:hypothetical protein n=1 Tax=Coleofasciculus sp. TaxID=3100458 RepID=UPI0039F8B907
MRFYILHRPWFGNNHGMEMLCALRRVLKEAKKLKLISVIDYAEAVDIDSVKASAPLRGRALSKQEVSALMRVW